MLVQVATVDHDIVRREAGDQASVVDGVDVSLGQDEVALGVLAQALVFSDQELLRVNMP